MFTWKPIHREAIHRILEHRENQQELLTILREMERQGHKVTCEMMLLYPAVDAPLSADYIHKGHRIHIRTLESHRARCQFALKPAQRHAMELLPLPSLRAPLRNGPRAMSSLPARRTRTRLRVTNGPGIPSDRTPGRGAPGPSEL